jgi:hypothetical protein
MGAQQTPVPGGTPQPQEQPEAGIAQLPTGPMNFRDGGIVSFQGANESLVDQNMPSDEESQFMKDLRKFGSRFTVSDEEKARQKELAKIRSEGALLPNYFTQSADKFAESRARRELANQNVLPSDLDPSRYIPESTDRPSPSTAEINALIGQGAQRAPSAGPRPPGAGGGRAPGGAPQAGAPQAGKPSADVNPYANLRERVEGQTLKLPQSPDVIRAERAKTDPYLNEQPGTRLEELYAKIGQRDEEDRARFLKNEEERKQGRLNRGLMAGAEATRGRGGLGALGSFFMGYGKAGEAEDEASRTRTDAQRKMEREQEVLRAEVLSKVQEARIARSEGRLKEAVGFEKDAATAENTFNQNKLTQIASLVQSEEVRRHNLSTEDYQRENLRATRMAAAKGPEIQQVYEFLAKKFPDKDPAALLEMAVKNTRPGIAGDASLARTLLDKEAKIREKYAMAKTILKGAELARIQALEDKEIEALRKSQQGIGGLDTSDPLPNVKVLGSRPAS